MKDRFKPVICLLMIPVLLASVAGCNIFDFASDAEMTPVEKAEEAIRDHDYVTAKEEFSDVIYLEDPNNPTVLVIKTNDSMVLYTYAKAALLASGITLMEILDLAQMEDTNFDGQDPNSVLENPILAKIDDKFTEDPAIVNAWYQQNRQIQQVLQLIADDQTVGEFENDDIVLDLTVSSMMSFMLGIRDTNQDGFINDDDFNLNFLLTSAQNMDAYALEGIYDAFIEDPESINEFVDFIAESAENSAEGILMLVGEDQAEYVEQITENIDTAKEFLDNYKYNDGIDNDGDGRIDEEELDGLDDDGDGLIDEDTKLVLSLP
ncbi:hypothetical protein ACFL6P_07640 [Candidatus Latescibacterota bacterium]